MGEFSASRRDPVPESAEPTCAESWGDAALQADQRAVLQFLKQLYAPKALPNVVAHPAQGNWKRCLFTTQVEKTGQHEDLVSVDVHFLVNDSALPYEHDVLLTSFESEALTIPCSVTPVLGIVDGTPSARKATDNAVRLSEHMPQAPISTGGAVSENGGVPS
jgi:hypothetical protein